MRTTVQLLNAIKTRHQVASDYRLAQLLGCRSSAIYGYRARRSCLDESMCIKVAELLNEPAGAILAEVAAERAKRPEVKKAWEAAARAAAAGATALFLLVIYLHGGADLEVLSAAFMLPGITHYTNLALQISLTFSILALWRAGMAGIDQRHHPTPADSV